MSLYSNIFDAHAHYDDKWFDDDRFELLENIHTKGVCGIVNNAVDLETAKICIEYAEKYDFMYAAVGFHPENLENIPDNYLEQLAQLSKHKKVVAIGETGLDYHWDIPKDLQKRVFEEQIRLSLDLEMPLIVHDREAHGDVYDLLRKYKPNALVHCFSGSVGQFVTGNAVGHHCRTRMLDRDQRGRHGNDGIAADFPAIFINRR